MNLLLCLSFLKSHTSSFPLGDLISCDFYHEPQEGRILKANKRNTARLIKCSHISELITVSTEVQAAKNATRPVKTFDELPRTCKRTFVIDLDALSTRYTRRWLFSFGTLSPKRSENLFFIFLRTPRNNPKWQPWLT